MVIRSVSLRSWIEPVGVELAVFVEGVRGEVPASSSLLRYEQGSSDSSVPAVCQWVLGPSCCIDQLAASWQPVAVAAAGARPAFAAVVVAAKLGCGRLHRLVSTCLYRGGR